MSNCTYTMRYFENKKATLCVGVKTGCTRIHNICYICFLTPLLLFTQYTLAIRKLLIERDNLQLFSSPYHYSINSARSPRAFRHIVNNRDFSTKKASRIIACLHQRPANTLFTSSRAVKTVF